MIGQIDVLLDRQLTMELATKTIVYLIYVMANEMADTAPVIL